SALAPAGSGEAAIPPVTGIFAVYLKAAKKGKTGPNDNILAEFLWFPLGQLIALQSSRRIAKGGRDVSATSVRRRSRSQKAIRRGHERRLETEFCVW
ncbi:MAG TPA: hypothetical protein VIY07_04890, partial [Pseudolabrys sp.]